MDKDLDYAKISGMGAPESSIPPLWMQLRAQSKSGLPDQILKICGIATPPVDVHLIAHRLGVSVREVHQPGWAGAVQSEGEKAMIWVKRADSPVRKRFTVAHELGHLLLHDTAGRAFRDNSRFSGDKLEKEANSFAAQLLVPLWMLEPAVIRFGGIDTVLARLFNVSDYVIRIRLAVLDAT